MPKSTFGEHLRREREMRGVSLEEIASATRISTRFLQALENEHWDRLPGGVFNRGFIRAVARFLGLDEESLVAEYAMATNDRPEVAVWASSAARAKPQRQALRWLLLLLLLPATGGGWLAYRHYAPLIAAWRSPLPQPPSPTPPGAPASVSGPTIAEASPSTHPLQPGITEPEALELKIEAGKTTVVTVIADGRTIFDGKMSAGENHRFQAKEKFEVSARNSSAVLLELNGQTMPPLGPPGEPGRMILTRKDLKNPQGGQD